LKPLPVLIVEDDASLREALTDTLELSGYEVIGAADGEAALRVLENRRVGIVVSDVQMKPMDGERLLREIKQRWPQLPVLLMTAYGLIERAVEAMRAGACNYLAKPFEPEALVSEVARWMLPAAQMEGREMVAEDAVTRALLDLAGRVAASDATVLITGESGVGKEVMARLIHQRSPRARAPFVAINCAAIPDNLLEATLFGYERGAFTGASQSQAGKFEQAQGGTLLLDEISEMPLALQAKLLRVLQEREVERVGGRKPIALDVRVLATSNRDLQAEVQAGRFREDLYYRINVFPLNIPPLRERPRDILPLARHLLARAAEAPGGRALDLAPEAESGLTAYTWRGNIRELENVLQRAMILAPGSRIELAHLCLPAAAGSPAAELAGTAGEGQPALPTDMKGLERAHILATLEAAGGVRRVAAQRLGMSERTLRYKLAQYRLQASGESEAQG
jgi:two-component system response regulator FlrC